MRSPESSVPPEQVGSRRARKKERTRREIFAAAIDLFLARGFDGVTIDDICAAADVARGTFFLHFPTKDALLSEYGQQVMAELADDLGNHRGGAADELRHAVTFLTARATRHAELVRLMVREVMARPVMLADHTEQSRDLVQMLAAIVERGQAAGEFRREIEPLIAGATVVAAYMAIVAEWARRSGRLDLGQAIEQSLDLVLRGLEQPGPAQPPAASR
jgi:AcrR family transcriptional regulator